MIIRIGDDMKKIKSSKDKIPTINYVKLVVIVLITVFFVFILRNWYINGRNYQLNIPVIRDTLINEINTDEVYNLVRENENIIFYVGVVNDELCRSFEKEFNHVIVDRKLEDTITYLNITKSSNKKKFIQEFNKFYGSNLSGYPSIVIFEEGEIKATFTVETEKELNMDSVIEFLDSNQVVSNSL